MYFVVNVNLINIVIIVIIKLKYLKIVEAKYNLWKYRKNYVNDF